jgi:hypothetical protein
VEGKRIREVEAKILEALNFGLYRTCRLSRGKLLYKPRSDPNRASAICLSLIAKNKKDSLSYHEITS